MSAWIDRILREFPADLARFWIACDPDDLLLDERILHNLRERGFEVLPFDDSIVFRTDYEERYRDAWDRGEEGPAKALILQLRGTEVDELPWDYLRQGRKVNLSLADLFPKLSYGVVRQVGSEYYEPLFDAQKKHAAQTHGDGATKDFILTHIFRISPYLISRSEDLWRELLRLHYRGDHLPLLLATHIARTLKENRAFDAIPIAELFCSHGFMVRIVQGAWDRFVASHASCNVRIEGLEQNSTPLVEIPFKHPDVRVIVDSMFLEGTLKPVSVQGYPENLPDWAKVGVVEDPNALAQLILDGASRIAKELPGLEASHREWVQLSRRLGELIFRFHSLSSSAADAITKQVRQLQRDADRRLREWVGRRFADLLFLPAAKGPVMVHHIPRFLALRRDAGEARIALLVFDGLAMDQWVQIRECLAQRAPEVTFDENTCFAWLPTLTSVSRQALFSGLKPREFANSIETTSQEPALWSRFWQDNGLRKDEVTFRKGLKRSSQLAEVEAAISSPTIKVAGIVVDVVDEIVHGAVLGKRGIASQLTEWCETGFVERLFKLLSEQGFHIYLTADHGNVEAVGIGRINEGVAAELRGERVRVYRSEALAQSVPNDVDAFGLDLAGLPANFLPVFAGGSGAFVSTGEHIVAHGGISVEELIVPFIKVSVTNAGR